MKGEPYNPGEVHGGLNIVKLLQEGRSQDTTSYLVSRTCCGEVLELTHTQIAKRVRCNQDLCVKCRYGFDTAHKQPRAVRYGVEIKSGPMRGWWPHLGEFKRT